MKSMENHKGNPEVALPPDKTPRTSPPGSTFRYSHKVSEAIEILSDIPADQYLICGDFNYPKIDWLNYVIPETNNNNNAENTSREIRFYDAIQNAFLHQHVTEPTRQRGSNTPSLLDLVLTKNELEIEYIDYQSE